MRSDMGSTDRTDLSFSIDNILREDFGPQIKQERPTLGRYYFGVPSPYYGLYYPWNYYSRLKFLSWLPVRPLCNNVGADCNTSSQSRPRELHGLEQEDNSTLQTEDDEAESNEDDREPDDDCSINSDDSEKNPSTANPQGKRQHEQSSPSELEPKRKRPRSQFTEMQLKYLENYFENNSYLSRDERTVLARALDMKELQIRNWFQNKRYQMRHKTATTTTSTTTIQEKNVEGAVSVEKTSSKDLHESKESSIANVQITKAMERKTEKEESTLSSKDVEERKSQSIE